MLRFSPRVCSSMAARVFRNSIRDLLCRRLRSASGAFMQSSSDSGSDVASPKIPPVSKKVYHLSPYRFSAGAGEFEGRLLTGAMIGLPIAGGAYVSTADEATFWYIILNLQVIFDLIFFNHECYAFYKVDNVSYLS